jgi:hypothetical protein
MPKKIRRKLLYYLAFLKKVDATFFKRIIYRFVFKRLFRIGPGSSQKSWPRKSVQSQRLDQRIAISRCEVAISQGLSLAPVCPTLPVLTATTHWKPRPVLGTILGTIKTKSENILAISTY